MRGIAHRRKTLPCESLPPLPRLDIDAIKEKIKKRVLELKAENAKNTEVTPKKTRWDSPTYPVFPTEEVVEPPRTDQTAKPEEKEDKEVQVKEKEVPVKEKEVQVKEKEVQVNLKPYAIKMKINPLPSPSLSGPPRLEQLKVVQPQISFCAYMCTECFKHCRKMPTKKENGRLIVQFPLCESCVKVNRQIREIYATCLFK
jgi:hypothetical protein